MEKRYEVGRVGIVAILLSISLLVYSLTLSPYMSGVERGYVLTILLMLVIGLTSIRYDFNKWNINAYYVILGLGASSVVFFTTTVLFKNLSVIPLSSLVIFTAVGEELFFRGFLQPLAIKFGMKPLYAIVFSSAMWSIYHLTSYHGSTVGIASIFVIGLIYGYIVEKTKSLDVTIMCHILVNFLASLGV